MPKSSKGTDPYEALNNFAATTPKTGEAIAAVERQEARINSKLGTSPKSGDALKAVERQETLIASALEPQTSAGYGFKSDSYVGYGMLSQPANNSAAARMMMATELINPLIARAEAAIHALGFHVTERVILDADEDTDWSRWLRFGKEGKSWLLTVESGPASDLNAWTRVPLHTTSRETRLKALSMLPELVDELSGRAEREAEAALKIVTDAENFIASLERSHQ